MTHRSRSLSVIRFTLLAASLILASLAHAGTYYVSTAGSDTADGKSKKSAWKTVAYAAKVAQPGDTVKVAPGDYGPEHILIGNSGTAEKPIVFEGLGDGPVFDRGERVGKYSDIGLGVINKRHVTIRNFNFTKYMVCVTIENSANITLEDVNTYDCGWETYMGSGIVLKNSNRCTLKKCTATNAGGENIHLYLSDDNLLENCSAIGTLPSSDKYATDYYLVISWSNRNKIKNFTSHDKAASGKGNHGIGIKDTNRRNRQTDEHGHSTGNEFTNCNAINFEEGLFCAWGAHHNTFINCSADSSQKDYYFGNAIMVRDGAHDNTFKNCRAIGAAEALCIYNNEMPLQKSGNDPQTGNRFVNCTFETKPHKYAKAKAPAGTFETVNGPCMFLRNARDTTFENCTFSNSATLFRFGKDVEGNETNGAVTLRECTIENVKQLLDTRALGYPWNLNNAQEAGYDGMKNVKFEKCKFTKNGFEAPNL